MPGNATTLPDALAGIARRAMEDIAAVAGAGDVEALRTLRDYAPAQAHHPAADLYERLRFAEHAVSRDHPHLAERLRCYGEEVERLRGGRCPVSPEAMPPALRHS